MSKDDTHDDGREQPRRPRERPRSTELGTRYSRGASLAKLSASTGAGFLSSRMRGLRDGETAEAIFHAETAERVLELLGQMKGAAMKLGQIASFVDLDLPPEVQRTYHEALSQLQDAAPPVDIAGIRNAVTEEFGAKPEEVFDEWDDDPLAAASIGQVHRARLPSGEPVAVKVQYPGVAEAVESDLANAESFAPLARLISPNLQLRPLMEELRLRIGEELDYQREAAYQQAFVDRYDGHPFIHVPAVFHDYCRSRVLTTELADGLTFDRMLATTDDPLRQRHAEIIYRFVYGSLYRFRLFNADPHPGNYLFPGDGTVVFLDFGSVKPFSTAARNTISEQLAAVLTGDAATLVAALDAAGFIPSGHTPDAERLMAFSRAFHEPVLADREWQYTPEFAQRVIRETTDPRHGSVDFLRKLNLPPDYLLLNRIQWGVNSILGRLEARANWHRITRELLWEEPAATSLGAEEAAFMSASPHRA